MSVKVSSWVWEHSKTGGGDRLLLLAIADCADDDGDNAWPSVATLARKTQTADRTVQRGIERLEREGCVEVDRGAGRGGTHRYRVLMDARAAGQVPPAEPVDNAMQPVDNSPEPVENQPQGVSDCHPVRLTGEVTQLRHRGGDTAVSPERPERPRTTTPPTPASRGSTICVHGASACRRCRTNPRSLGTNPRAVVDRQDLAAAEAAAAEVDRYERDRRALPPCHADDCDPETRWRSTDRGERRCPDCHPDVVIGRPPPELAALAEQLPDLRRRAS